MAEPDWYEIGRQHSIEEQAAEEEEVDRLRAEVQRLRALLGFEGYHDAGCVVFSHDGACDCATALAEEKRAW